MLRKYLDENPGCLHFNTVKKCFDALECTILLEDHENTAFDLLSIEEQEEEEWLHENLFHKCVGVTPFVPVSVFRDSPELSEQISNFYLYMYPNGRGLDKSQVLLVGDLSCAHAETRVFFSID